MMAVSASTVGLDMIEKFDRTPQGLKTPMCTRCSEPMIWYRSTLSEDRPGSISHYFQCAKCNDIQEIQVKAPEGGASN